MWWFSLRSGSLENAPHLNLNKINGKLTGDNKILFSVLKRLDLIERHKSKQ